MKKTFTKIFTDEHLNYLELRYSNSNTHYKNHFHDTFSIGINKKGTSLYTNENNKYFLGKNMISIINPHIVHSCNASSDVLNEYYMMYLDLSWCKNLQSIINKDVKVFQHIPIDILEDKILYNEYIYLCEFLFSKSSYQEKEDELIKFFLNFFSLYLKNNIKREDNNIFVNIIEFMKNNYKENISLDDLANKFNLNKFYIIKLFKDEVNLTPHSYFLNIKINKAKEMLKNDFSIIDTALECGFFDQSHFHRNFLKMVAITPNEYKLNFVQ